MIEAGIEGVDFIAVNTDQQALNANRAPIKIQLGTQLTKGLGSGGRPETGKQAAMEDTERLLEVLEGSDMVFLTTGLGGGRGPGRPRSSPTWPPSSTSSAWPSAPCPSSSKGGSAAGRPSKG